jgi:hypothetical protein
VIKCTSLTWAVSSAGRALALHASGRGFEPLIAHRSTSWGRSSVRLERMPVTHEAASSSLVVPAVLFGQIAQMVEQRTENPRVVGSIPTLAILCHTGMAA